MSIFDYFKKKEEVKSEPDKQKAAEDGAAQDEALSFKEDK